MCRVDCCIYPYVQYRPFNAGRDIESKTARKRPKHMVEPWGTCPGLRHQYLCGIALGLRDQLILH